MPGHPGAGGGMMGPPVNESLQIYVPNSAVGAIIGAGGANIKQIMRESGAFVNVSILLCIYPSLHGHWQLSDMKGIGPVKINQSISQSITFGRAPITGDHWF